MHASVNLKWRKASGTHLTVASIWDDSREVSRTGFCFCSLAAVHVVTPLCLWDRKVEHEHLIGCLLLRINRDEWYRYCIVQSKPSASKSFWYWPLSGIDWLSLTLVNWWIYVCSNFEIPHSTHHDNYFLGEEETKEPFSHFTSPWRQR